jgi:hypothetical protein
MMGVMPSSLRFRFPELPSSSGRLSSSARLNSSGRFNADIVTDGNSMGMKRRRTAVLFSCATFLFYMYGGVFSRVQAVLPSKATAKCL